MCILMILAWQVTSSRGVCVCVCVYVADKPTRTEVTMESRAGEIVCVCTFSLPHTHTPGWFGPAGTEDLHTDSMLMLIRLQTQPSTINITHAHTHTHTHTHISITT